jgi:hypothetical protein
VASWTEAERVGMMEAVLDRMCGGWTVEEAVRGVEGEFEKLPVSSATVRQWFVRAEPEMQGRYREARRMMGSALAEEALLVARNTSNATAVADRLLVDTLRWKAGKANPAEYGEKQVVEHQGQQKLEIVVREESKAIRGQEVGGQIAAGIVATATLNSSAGAVLKLEGAKTIEELAEAIQDNL